MDLSKIHEHQPVYADRSGGLNTASEVVIGYVDRIEGDKYIKLTKRNPIDGQHHWFPLDWIRAVDERAVFLNKTLDEIETGLLNEAPTS